MPEGKEKKLLSRRTALKTLAGTIAAFPILNNQALEAALHVHRRLARATPAPGAAAAFQPKFFTPAENELVTIISDLIIPTDEKSPGAKEARVNEFIDLMISEAEGDERALWRDGLQAVNRESAKQFGKNFVEASEDRQISLLEAMSQNERNPRNLRERFFDQIKRRTIQGYYTSEIGLHQDLEYKGNTVMLEFEGCTHPEHGA
ncbi:MAG: gluconate 2-dehydrogenase subunit 3 family protein [Acidobacteriota bacterium]